MKYSFLTLVAALLLVGCSTPAEPQYKTLDGFAQGTTYHIVYKDPEGRDLRPVIEELLDEFNAVFSLYDSTSLISRINRNDPSVEPNASFSQCYAISEKIYRDTHGAFDITVRPLVQAYRIGKSDPRTPPRSEIDSIRAFVGMDKVSITPEGVVRKSDPRLSIDMNAIAQGYSVDLVGALLGELGVKDYIVEIGGELLCRGSNPKGGEWRVGIDRPVDGNLTPGEDMQAIIALSDGALVTSGNYRKFGFDEQGNKVTHTIDPHTAMPAHHNLLSATILAPTAAIADGYATACMVIGLEKSRQMIENDPELEGYLIYSDSTGAMKVYSTPGVHSKVIVR